MAILPERHTALVPGAIVSIGAECAIGVVMWQRSLLYMVALLDAGAQGCKTGDTAYEEIGDRSVASIRKAADTSEHCCWVVHGT